MNARNKLNISYLNGAILLAGAVGLGFGSWGLFGVAVATLVLSSLANGNIRPDRTGEH